MADGSEEEIIIIEDSDAQDGAVSSGESQTQEDSSSAKKKKLIYIGTGVAVVILLAVIAFFIFQKLHKKPSHASVEQIKEKVEKEIGEHVEPSKIENMIAKADYLYSTGSKEEALYLYEKIAHYSEAISAYNLGVAQLKDSQYETALASFQKAIQNNEKRCVSAINAAVCSLYLNNEKNFNYYIDLAYAYLPQEMPSPLYSYYYSLINYYNGNYLEALSSLNNSTTQEYVEIQNSLSSKINALFDNDVDAIVSMEKNGNASDYFSLGLLYARVGDLEEAKKSLQKAIQNNIEPMRAQLALGLIKLKIGEVQNASKEIENVTDVFADKVYEPFPIQVKLKDSLFNQDLAQKRYRNIVIDSKQIIYQKLFYFSPYKIFNANQTISYIRKGTANIFVDNVDSAQEYLKQGTLASNVNAGIVNAIKKALSFKIREANEMLQKLVEIQPKHSILHYNLALTYAQMGNMLDANKHFLRSYNLDAKNYLSGIYAIMTSQLINKESEKLSSIIKDSIMHEEKSEDVDFYMTLMHLTQDNIIGTVDWLGKNYQQKPIYLALDIIVALKQNNVEAAKKSAETLATLLPNEILPHLMYIDANFSKLGTKEYANEVLNYLKKQKFDFNDLYFGAYVTRYLYVQQNLITGKLYYLKEHVRKMLESTTQNTHELTGTLALASLYDGAYEESYTLYNNLIDDLKVQDSQTLFLGAVASTAANHHENAIALLELSKMKDANFLESRYALGLLYLEIKNNKGAIIQLSKINNNFNSEYFNFDIDTDKLMYEKNLSLKQ